MKLLGFANLLYVLLILSACTTDQKNNQTDLSPVVPSNYFDELSHYRSEQNRLFAGPDSPLPDSLKPGFKGINYYEPDSGWRITANFNKIKDGPIFKMQATGPVADNYQLMGKLLFNINQQDMELEVYQHTELRDAGYNYYFIPFYDLSNGNETYGGGRYIEVPVVSGNKIVVDFNYAYQPYCANNHD